MSGAPAITFAVPFYRDARYLARTVASVLNQTRDDWQLVVIDDGGPDGEAAREVVEALRDARASYVRADTNLGLAGNWNRCLDAARTPYVTLLHADDELLPSYVGAVLAGHARHPGAAAVHCATTVIDAGGRPTFSAPDAFKRVLAPRRPIDRVISGDAGLARLMIGNTVFCPTLCYATAVIGARRFDARWRFVLDLAFVADLVFDGASIVGVPDVAYRYRRHGASQTAELTASDRRFAEEVALHRSIAASARTLGWSATARAAAAMPSVRLHAAARGAAGIAGRATGGARGYAAGLARGVLPGRDRFDDGSNDR